MPSPFRPDPRGLALAAAAVLALCGCKIERTADLVQAPAPADPKAGVAQAFPAKVAPYIAGHAAPFADQQSALAADPAAAKAKYGLPKGGGVFAARIAGKVLSVDAGTRTGGMQVDVDADGKADAVVLLGPTIPGTAIRDALDFVSFGDFPSQVEYAGYGRALNEHVVSTLLAPLDRKALVGAHVEVLGVYYASGPSGPVRITPVQLTVGPS